MPNPFLAEAQNLLRRGRRLLGGGFDYQSAYRTADLEQNYWSIVGPASAKEFKRLGQVKRDLLIEQGLTPSSHLLDVGCGTGQLTVALTDYLDANGFYCGTDIAPEAIAFCQRQFVRPNFVFCISEMTRLRVNDRRFDVAYFGSVFTHMYAEEIRDLLRDTARVMRSGGWIVADAFVSTNPVKRSDDRYMVVMNESHLHDMFDAAGFRRESRTEVIRAPWQPSHVQRVVYRFDFADL